MKPVRTRHAEKLRDAILASDSRLAHAVIEVGRDHSADKAVWIYLRAHPEYAADLRSFEDHYKVYQRVSSLAEEYYPGYFVYPGFLRDDVQIEDVLQESQIEDVKPGDGTPRVLRFAFTLEQASDVPGAILADCPGCLDTCTWGYSFPEARELLCDAVQMRLEDHWGRRCQVAASELTEIRPNVWTGILTYREEP